MECTLQLGDAAVPSPLPGATLIKLRRPLNNSRRQDATTVQQGERLHYELQPRTHGSAAANHRNSS